MLPSLPPLLSPPSLGGLIWESEGCISLLLINTKFPNGEKGEGCSDEHWVPVRVRGRENICKSVCIFHLRFGFAPINNLCFRTANRSPYKAEREREISEGEKGTKSLRRRRRPLPLINEFLFAFDGTWHPEALFLAADGGGGGGGPWTEGFHRAAIWNGVPDALAVFAGFSSHTCLACIVMVISHVATTQNCTPMHHNKVQTLVYNLSLSISPLRPCCKCTARTHMRRKRRTFSSSNLSQPKRQPGSMRRERGGREQLLKTNPAALA